MVLHENAIGNIVSLSSFQDFAYKYFDIRLSYSTISRYLDEDGFACRLVKKKGKSFVVDIDALVLSSGNGILFKIIDPEALKETNYVRRTAHLPAIGQRGALVC